MSLMRRATRLSHRKTGKVASPRKSRLPNLNKRRPKEMKHISNAWKRGVARRKRPGFSGGNEE